MPPTQTSLTVFFAPAPPPSSLSQQQRDDALDDDAPAGTEPHAAERLFQEKEEEDDDDNDGDTGDGDAPAPAGAVGAQQTPDAVHTSLKRKREEPAGGTEEIVSYGFLANGQFGIITNRRKIIIFKDTADYLQSINKLRNLQILGNGYVSSSDRTPFHQLVGDEFCMTDDQVRAQYPEHFKANPHDKIVVMHLDNDRLNFNIENLERGPQMLNKYMHMAQPIKYGTGYCGFVVVNKKRECTKKVDTVEEAKHAMDILKMQKMPPEFRSFIFKHAMHKPVEYAENYDSIETLLSQASKYVKKIYKPQKPREPQNTYQAFRTLDEARKALTEQMKIIDSILDTKRVVPFDADLDAVILYTGARGKQIVLLLEYLCYLEHLAKTKPAMIINSKGYISINLADGLNPLHNVILGRPLHQSVIDGLQGGHGWGKQLDNRKRVLSPQTVAENLSQRGQADAKSVPGVVGVTKWKNGRFKVLIHSFFERGDTANLGYFETAEEASAVYQFAYNNKQQLVEMCKDLDDPKAELRARCRAKSVYL